MTAPARTLFNKETVQSRQFLPLLRSIQKILEKIYHLEIEEDIHRFLLDGRIFSALEAPFTAGPGKDPLRSQVVLLEEDDGIDLGVYIDEEVLSRLGGITLFSLNDNEIADYCVLVEETSHFLSIVWHVKQERPTTKLEMELQAEVDKFVFLLALFEGLCLPPPPSLLALLFERFHLEKGLSDEEKDRYLTVNRLAQGYCRFLESAFEPKLSSTSLLSELRGFYRLGLQEKIRTIRQKTPPH